MSLILEALKKAERLHKLGEVPGLGTSQVPEQPPTSHWLSLLMLLAVAAGMLFLGVYLGGWSPADKPQLAEPAESHQPSVETSTVPPRVDEPPPLVREQDAEPQPASTHSLQPTPAPVIGGAVPEPEATPAEVVVPAELPEPPAEAVPEKPKRLSELPPGFVDRLPKLNIDIHSYDSQGKKSYVLINLEKYREGDYLAEGPLLSEIRPDGVVMEHMGERFFLPIGNR